MSEPLEGRSVLITGGTGSLGQVLVRRILSGEAGRPSQVVVFSRDEAKQHEMRLEFLHRAAATDDVIYRNSRELLSFRIGDVRDYASLLGAVSRADVIFNAAALKQVPTCEYFPFEAVQTNVIGAQNIVRAIHDSRATVSTVVGISTDKACKPINVMGMTKALQERIFVQANIDLANTRLVCVRYGNVIASRGSVVPLFLDQIRRGGPVTVTLPEMTRFLLTLDRAVDTVFAALSSARRGETYVPRVPAARIVDLATALMRDRTVAISFTGIRPGEKLHEIMISEEESYRTIERGGYYVCAPILPELREGSMPPRIIEGEYSSANSVISLEEVRALVADYLGKAA